MKAKDIGNLCLAFKAYHGLKFKDDVVVCHEAALALHLGLYGTRRDVDSVLLEVPLSVYERYKTSTNLRQSQFGEYIVINEQLSLRRAGWDSHYLYGWVSLSYYPKDYTSQSRESLLEWLAIRLETGEHLEGEIDQLLSDMTEMASGLQPGWGNDPDWSTALLQRVGILKEKYA